MKNIVKIIVLGLLISFTSCSDSEVLIDEVYDSVDTETGVVVRTVSPPAELVSLTNPDNNNISLTIEVQEGNGSTVPDFKEVRAYVRLYADQDLAEPLTTENGGEILETLSGVADSSIFELSPNGLPRGDFSFPTQQIVDGYVAAGAVLEDFPVPTFIALRLEVEMTDGRIYTNTDVSVAVGGGVYFVSPYFYRIIFLPF